MCHYESENAALISARKRNKNILRPGAPPGPARELTVLPQTPAGLNE